MKPDEPILLQKMDGEAWDIEAYRRLGGYDAWRKCLKEPQRGEIVEELKRSGLRGRGGAGFPTGTKWEKVLHHRSKERYFVCNAGEHEPGTFKDRFLVKHYPHQLLEGCLIAAYTVEAKASFIYLNHEYQEERENLLKAMEQARAEGFLGKNILGSGVDLDIEVFEGQGSYVAGEETAMLESMQGRPAMPRQKPPFYPTDFGLYGKPTLVNNVETLCTIPRILQKGAGWFTSFGTDKCPGTMLFSLSGAVNKPGYIDIPTDATMTVSMAISQAGSYNKFASTGRIQVLRHTPGGETQKFVVDLDAVLNGNFDKDIVLQPGDVIWVPERGIF